MFISKRRHDAIVAALNTEIERLKEKSDLKEILQQHHNNYLACSSGSMNWSQLDVNLPDDVPRYVEDYFGGKVFKQEANKVVVIDEAGNATYSQTKKDNEKGYKYILVRK